MSRVGYGSAIFSSGLFGQLTSGSVLSGMVRIADWYAVQLPTMKPLDFLLEKMGAYEELGLIQAVRDNMVGAAAVYGDYLEEKGRPKAAEMVRGGWIP